MKINLHPRNRNRAQYDLRAMSNSSPELSEFIFQNKYGTETIDFSDLKAVRVLNSAILKFYYGINNWEFPMKNLTPPIPGRAEYIHHVADLLSEGCNGSISKGKKITCLDIGIGASCIYPIIGVVEYDWNFIGVDVSISSLQAAQEIINSNPILKEKIECRLQKVPAQIFKDVITENDKIDITICNPPFHSSKNEANKGTIRKVKNLTGKTKTKKRNFSGQKNELVYKGGEFQFISNMIAESILFSHSCGWFSTLVSKVSNLKALYKILNRSNPTDVRTMRISTGNKETRILAWTYLK